MFKIHLLLKLKSRGVQWILSLSCLIGTVLVFQNCGTMPTQDITVNPNTAPLSQASSGALIAPNTLTSKLVDGVDVQGFDSGSWMYAFVDDQCVLARKDIVFSTQLYFLDPYLKKQFDFAAAVGKFNVSMISFQLTQFISKEDFERALSFDLCATGSYISAASPSAVTYTTPNTSQGSSPAWSLMHLDASVLSNILAINKSTKVQIGITAPGFNSQVTPPMPLAANAVGLTNSDPDGFGTALASLIATPANPNNVRGVADGVAQLIPVPYPPLYQQMKLSALIFNVMKQMVNRGAEVVLLPLTLNTEDFCDPLIGQALFYAIERGTTVVVPAGAKVGFGPAAAPGEIVGPRDYNLFQSSKTMQVACWGRYFRGVITVAARNTNASKVEFASFSNFGPEGVEIIAPGTDVATEDQNSHVNLSSGTEVSAALTTGAVAQIISFYKSKNWYYSPWLVEDTLMNGSIASQDLPDTGKSIRHKKVLDFLALSAFLQNLASGTESSARNQPSDNPESGQSINLGSLSPGETPTKLDVFSKNTSVFVKDRAQFQAVYYYISGAVKVVTDSVTWTSSDPANFPVDAQGIVRPAKAGLFTISAYDPVTRFTNSYTTQALDVDTISGESAKLVRLELRDYDYNKTNPAFKKANDIYELQNFTLPVDVYAVYDNGVSRKVTENSVYTIMYNGSVLAPDYIQQNSSAIFLSRYGFFRGGQTHDLMLFYRGFSQTLKVKAQTYTFSDWQWSENTKSTTWNKPIFSISPSEVQLYNVGQWFGIQFKVPHCVILGKDSICPPTTRFDAIWGCSSSMACGYQTSSTLPSAGLSIPGAMGYGTSVPAGVYQLDQNYQFWGDNSGAMKPSSIKITVLETPKVKVFQYAAWSFGDVYLDNSSPNSSEGTVQLAPACTGVQGLIYNSNSDLGISEYFRKQNYDSVSEVSITNGAGASFTDFITDVYKNSILITKPVDSPKLNDHLTDLNISAVIKGPNRVIADPFDLDLNSAEKQLGSKNYVTPKSLPALPAAPALDSRCNTAAVTNGSHAGDGSLSAPFIVCSWSEIDKLVTEQDRAKVINYYVALGADIDLAGVLKPTIELKGVKDFDGKNYRIKNANFVDAENSVSLFKSGQKIHDLVFINNSLTGKNLSLLYGSWIVKNVYAYDNLLIASNFMGVADNSTQCMNIYTRNQIRYSVNGAGVCGWGVTTNIQNFSEDDVRYTGLPGSGYYIGVGEGAIASGSNSTIVGGANIGGVAYNFCYKCFSSVKIDTTNHNLVGGILVALHRVGNLEVGESSAQILVAGTGHAGGVVGMINNSAGSSANHSFNLDPESYQYANVTEVYGHVHLLKPKFTGSVNGTGSIGGLVGRDVSWSDTYFSNAVVTGTVGGAGIKGYLVGTASGQCVLSVPKAFRVFNVSTTSSTPAVGQAQSGAPIVAGKPF